MTAVPCMTTVPCATAVQLPQSIPITAIGPWVYRRLSIRLEPLDNSDNILFKPLLLWLEQHLVPSKH